MYSRRNDFLELNKKANSKLLVVKKKKETQEVARKTECKQKFGSLDDGPITSIRIMQESTYFLFSGMGTRAL